MWHDVSEYPQFDDNSPPDLEDPDYTQEFITSLEAAAVTTCSQAGNLKRQTWTHLDEDDAWDDPKFIELLSKRQFDDMEGGSATKPPGNTLDSELTSSPMHEHDHGTKPESDMSRTPAADMHMPVAENSVGMAALKDTSDVSSPYSINNDTMIRDAVSQSATNLRAPDVNIDSDDEFLGIIGSKFNGINVMNVIRNNYPEDPFFKCVLAAPNQFQNFKLQEKLLYLTDHGCEVLCIPKKITFKGRTLRELIISEAHSLLAHLGPMKTLTYLKDHVWWKNMTDDTVKFCSTCEMCVHSKPNNQKPYRLLNLLEVPCQPWETIGIDFVELLPELSDRNASYNQITMGINLLTAMVLLIPSRIDYTAKDVVELVFQEVYKNYGLPENIVSDQDVLFMSHFWQELHKLIGVKLRMSTAYHPQTDGAMERTNRTITQMVQTWISPDQKNWVQRLPRIQFAINSAWSESTGFAPFYLNLGRIPKAMVWNNPQECSYPGVNSFAEQIKLTLMSAHDSIIAAQVKQTQDANRKCHYAPFSVNDLVYLLTQNIKMQKGLVRKFAPKFIGPYKIIKDYSNDFFMIDLPPELKCHRFHPTFHASLLRIHIPSDDHLFLGHLAS
jgi:hypothetical protein